MYVCVSASFRIQRIKKITGMELCGQKLGICTPSAKYRQAAFQEVRQLIGPTAMYTNISDE